MNIITAGIASFLELRSWRYDPKADIAKNISDYERIVTRYNACSESVSSDGKKTEILSQRMKRDIFVYGLPPKAKGKILNHIRLMPIEKATFNVVLQLLREIEKERDVVMKDRAEQAALALVVKERERRKEKGDNQQRKQYREHKYNRDKRNHEHNGTNREAADRKHHTRTKPRNADKPVEPDVKRSKLECYKCKKSGHIIASCPETKCFSYNKYGHIGSNCPRKGAAHYVGGQDSDASFSVSSEGKIYYTILDSGASEHFFKHEEVLERKITLDEPKMVGCANGTDIKLTECGEVNLKIKGGGKMKLKKVFASEKFAQNLLSVSRLADEGYWVIFKRDKAEVLEAETLRVLFSIPRVGNVYKTKFSMCKNESGEAYLSVIEENQGESQEIASEAKEANESEKLRKRKTEEREGTKKALMCILALRIQVN